MNHGSLFSGIGGFDIAAEWMGWNNVFHCEKDEEKIKDLKRNFPKSISHGDIETTDFSIYRGRIDIITGGFPCQDASTAKTDGKGQKGLQGERTGLYFHMCRAIKESGAKYGVFENVANILKTNGGEDFSRMLSELAGMGYNAEWRVCRASEVGAPHQRARLYMVVYTNSIRLQKGQTFFQYVHEKTSSFAWIIAGTTIQISRGGTWNTEPPVLCLDNGVSRKLVGRQLHGYGNAIVPQIAYKIFKAIEEYEKVIN